MKAAVLIALMLLSFTQSVSGQILINNDPVLNFGLLSIQQRGSDNSVLFLQKDPGINQKDQQPINNLTIKQAGFENTLILSDMKNADARLHITQEGMNNYLFLEDVRAPLQIRQSGGMELIIRGNNFNLPNNQ